MNNNAALHVIATMHAMEHAEKGEPWFCQCIACKFTKEFKILVEDNDKTRETTMAESLLSTMHEQGYHTSIP